MGAPRQKCPHCHQPLIIRTSTSEHALLRTTYMQCSNVLCGATFRGTMEITHTLSPSAIPDPAIELPLADAAMRQTAVQRKPVEHQMDIEDFAK